MDDYPDEMPDGSEMISGIVGLFHIVVFYFAIRWVIRLCKRAPETDAAAAGAALPQANEDQLQPKKSVVTCYILWLIAGPVGAHHYYLGRLVHGIIATWTMNFCFVGWMWDMFLIPCYVRSFNKGLTHSQAPYDGSKRGLCIRLPMTLFSIVMIILGLLCYTPTVLHKFGTVDLDRIAAQTQTNPYETLGVSRGATLHDAKSAYRKASLKWHPDRNVGCGKECEDKMSEITKAFELIKNRAGQGSSGRTWEDKFRDLGKDWQSLIMHWGGDGSR